MNHTTDHDHGAVATGDAPQHVARRDAHAAHQGRQGHGERGGHGDHVAQFRRLFWWNLLLAVPVVAFSEMFSDLLGYGRPGGTAWISPVFGVIVFVVGGRPFLTGAYHEVRTRQPGMMLLIGLAISVAFVASLATSLGIGDLDLDFWWELALLIVIVLLGHWLEMRAVGLAQGALAALAELLPDEADRVRADGSVEAIPLHELRVGDTALVRPGGRVPADGEVVDGEAEFDESMVTGESRPVPKAPAIASWPAASRPTPLFGSASTPSARTLHSPGSSASSRKRRSHAHTRRRSPTEPRPSSSTLRPPPASSRSRCGCSSGTPMPPSRTPSRCW
jgi:Cu2+-exporting ATPase